MEEVRVAIQEKVFEGDEFNEKKIDMLLKEIEKNKNGKNYTEIKSELKEKGFQENLINSAIEQHNRKIREIRIKNFVKNQTEISIEEPCNKAEINNTKQAPTNNNNNNNNNEPSNEPEKKFEDNGSKKEIIPANKELLTQNTNEKKPEPTANNKKKNNKLNLKDIHNFILKSRITKIALIIAVPIIIVSIYRLFKKRF